MRRIDTARDISDGLEALVALDRRFEAIIAFAGETPLRRSPPGFESLCSIVVSQQVSVSAADAIHARLVAAIDPLTAEAVLAAGAEALGAAGLSRPKQRTLLAVAQALADGDLDLFAVLDLPAEAAIAHMTRIKGIGPWTAEIYLLFCAGHPDIFPSRDVALQAAVHGAFGLSGRPDEKALAALAAGWSPWRGVAARLFWSWYGQARSRDALAGGFAGTTG